MAVAEESCKEAAVEARIGINGSIDALASVRGTRTSRSKRSATEANRLEDH